MGHDITAIKNYEEHQKFWKNFKGNENTEEFRRKSEIAYLRRNMSSRTIKEFYEFLHCECNYNGVSGDGAFVIVGLEELREAKRKTLDHSFGSKDMRDYCEFLQKCITYCEENNKEGIIINFG